MKALLKPVYNLAHTLLYDAMAYHPFFSKKSKGLKIKQGFVSDEPLKNPELDLQLLPVLNALGIRTSDFTIDINGYRRYIEEENYPVSYYGGGFDKSKNFIEKTLEHFVSLSFLNLKSEQVFIDVAAATSPFSAIVQKKFRLGKSYQQDLVYERGINGTKIGGYAHEIMLPDNSVDAVSLHCSLEHFEDSSDIAFFKTVQRILKPGGRCVVLPFYIADTYTIHIDPAFNLLNAHHPVIDELAQLRYCKWKQYHSRHYDPAALKRRILNACPELALTVYRVNNFKEVSSTSYLRFIGVFEKLK